MSFSARSNTALPVDTTINETTTLLDPAGAQDPTTSSSEAGVVNVTDVITQDVPLDFTQMTFLCYARLVEPIAFFSIFPFVNDMIKGFGVPEENCGFYSGLIESLFSITQMLLMISWGKAADRFGRKPVLVFSLAGVSVATSMFGLSQSIWQMIVFRCLAGVFAGSILTVRAMISENSTSKTQARAFSLFGFAGNLGIFIGPLIGGSLATPAKQYPGLFGNIQFFHSYPYALPCFITGIVGISATLLSLLFIKETLKPQNGDREVGQEIAKELSTWELITSTGVSTVLVVYGIVMLLALSYTAVVPVFQFTTIAKGGFGFSPIEISTFLALAGMGQSLWTLLVFPPLQRKISTKGVLKLCSYAWPFFFAGNPLLVILLRNGMSTKWLYGLLGFAMIVGSGVAMAFIGVQLALNDISPNQRALGMLNGIALTLTSGIRAFAPALFTSLFATGVRLHILGGLFIWVILIGIATALIVALKWLPADKEIDEN